MPQFLKNLAKFTCGLFLVVGCATSTLAPTASAQVDSGLVAGNVTDQSDAVVVGAAVSVTNLNTNAVRSATTSATGAYQVSGLEPATYQVTISSSNFKPFTAKVEVTVGGHITLDAKLSVNSSTTEVEVVAAGGTQVNTQTQELSQIVDSQQLSQLPSLTRNPYDFVALSGNVSSGDNTTNSMSSGQTLTTRGVGVAVNGQRESGTEILLDGVENVGVFGASVGEDIPTDAVQEYSVITNNFAAEYGRASGGVVNLTTKAGANQFHGSGWEFNRLAAYTANTYANDAANSAAGSIVDPKGQYTRNQFGFQVGGPVLRNKVFFSESTEWTRVRSAATESEEIFDPSFIAMLPSNAQSYFSTYGTGAAASSGTVTTAGQLVAAGNTIGPINNSTAVPSSTPVFDTVNFSAPFDAGGGVPENSYTLVARVDYNLSDKTQMFFRAARENVDQFLGSAFYSAYPQYDVGTTDVNQSYLYSLIHTFSSNLLASAKVSFTRFNDANSFNAALTNTPNLMLVTNSDPVTGGEIQLPGLENFSEPGEGGLPFGGPQNTIQIEPDVSWVKGKHSMKFGGQSTYIQLNVAYGAYAQAVEQLGSNFQDSMNDLLNVADNPGGSQLSGTSGFSARVNPQGKLPCALTIYGNEPYPIPSSCLVTPPLSSATYGRSYRYKDWAIYGQDSFRITPRLTLNYGLRYEHYGVQHNNNPALDSNFYFGSGTGIEEQTRDGGIQIADQSSIGQFWTPRWGTLAPRIGFAYDIMGDGKSSIRGGFGISYERNFGNVTYNASFNPPASAVLSATCSPEDIKCATLVTNNDLGPLGVAGTAASALPPVELRMPDPNIQVAQTQFWSLALQREIARNTVVEVGYSGAHGVHLYDIQNINQVGAAQAYLGDSLVTGSACPYANEATGEGECLTRPNQAYAAINMRGSSGSSSYEALNIKLQTQNLHRSGLSMVANYTYSKSLDDLSSTFGDSLQGGSGDIGSLGYTDLQHPGLDWGPSDFDERHRLAVSPIWETPWFKTGNALLREGLGGWTASGIFTIRTGIPFSVYDYDNIEVGYTVPRLTPATPISNYHVGSHVASGPNNFSALSIPVPASFAPLNTTLGMSDLGPFPAGMTSRNAFRGPGAWNTDLALDKKFPLTERLGLEFRAEGFDLFNHHNYYVNSTNLLYSEPTATPLEVTELKGGLGTLATGGNHDERRFGQFALKVNF
jgi:hypothetical protein